MIFDKHAQKAGMLIFMTAALSLGLMAGSTMIARAQEPEETVGAAQTITISVRYVGPIVERGVVLAEEKQGRDMAADDAITGGERGLGGFAMLSSGGAAGAQADHAGAEQSLSVWEDAAADAKDSGESAAEQAAGEAAAYGGGAAYSRADLDALARIIWWEARGDSHEGKMAVGQVVINRVLSPLFPDTIAKVISQKNQFSPYENGDYFNVSVTPDCYEAAIAVLSGDYSMPEEVLWFRSDVKKQQWRDAVYYATIGEHYFYISQ